MIREILLAGVCILSCTVSPVVAADVKVKIPIAESMDLHMVKSSLRRDVDLYWGDQPHPPVVRNFGRYKTSKRTNGFAKARSEACARAMASSLLVLQERAAREGGNAVINIVSNLKDNEESSNTNYSCLAGAMMVNVALKGTVVTLDQ